MSTTSHTTGKSIAELKALVEQDRAMANQLQERIEKLRQDLNEGKLEETQSNLNIMEYSNKQTTKELVLCIEQIEDQGSLTATDREMLQALNARLAVCDLQAMKMAELGELEHQIRRARDNIEPNTKKKHMDEEEEVEMPKVEQMQGEDDMPAFAEGGVSAFSDDSSDGNDSVKDDDAEDVEVKHEDWHTPYRVLNLDHAMTDEEIGTEAKKALARLNPKHNPTRLPNDTDAPRRWEIIMKAYGLVTDPDKRRYLETSHKLPTELLDLDIEGLKLKKSDAQVTDGLVHHCCPRHHRNLSKISQTTTITVMAKIHVGPVDTVHARDHGSPETSPLGRDELELWPAAAQEYRDLRLAASKLCDLYNLPAIHDSTPDDRAELLKKLLRLPDDLSAYCSVPRIKSPFYADYGVKLNIHHSVFINRNCMILDNPIWPITIDEDTMIGPNVVISSVSHPSDWRVRKGQLGPSLGGPVKVGKNCFIGANVTILAGVVIGDGCVIGACSVVTRSIPDYHVAVGSPARVTHKVDHCVPDAVGLEYASDGLYVLPKEVGRSEAGDDVCDLASIYRQDRNVVGAVPANLLTIFALLMLTVWLCFVTAYLV